MRRINLLTLFVLFIAIPALVAATALPGDVPAQREDPGRGDDVARIERWRTFLDRASRAFFAARLPVSEVDAKIAEAEERLAELADADPDTAEGGRRDITGDVAFLERAHRAFTAARMSTADVQKWLEEAREAAGEAVG